MKKQEDGSELWDYTTNTVEGAESLEELEQEEWDALRLMEEKAQQGLSYMEEKIAGLDAREIWVYAATGLTLFSYCVSDQFCATLPFLLLPAILPTTRANHLTPVPLSTSFIPSFPSLESLTTAPLPPFFSPPPCCAPLAPVLSGSYALLTSRQLPLLAELAALTTWWLPLLAEPAMLTT
jgi:hypothetical protein